MDLDPEMVAYIITIVLGLISALLGSKWQKAKTGLSDSQLVVFKVSQALKVTSEAIEDDQVSSEEEKRIVNSWKDVIDEAKDMLK